MHGLALRAVQLFVTDCYGPESWAAVADAGGLAHTRFEAMLLYDAGTALAVLEGLPRAPGRPIGEILEDLGTYLVSNPRLERLRRLMRFGGESFEEFLVSLEDLPDRARLAVSDLDLPEIELREHSARCYSVACRCCLPGFAEVLTGVVRTMADDYGLLALVEHSGSRNGVHTIAVTLLETTFAKGRAFQLGAAI